MMKPKRSLAKASKAANVTPIPPLNQSFEIFVSLVGMKHHMSKEKQKLLQEGVTAVTLTRETSHEFDPQNAIVAHVHQHKIGYVRGKDYAKILSPWMDNSLLEIESAKVYKIKGESTVDLIVKGRACQAAGEMLESLSN